VDVGLSNHHLLTWSAAALRPQPPIETVFRRPWRSLNIDELRDELRASSLCQPDNWPDDVDDMAESYDAVLTSILDRLVPVRWIVRRPRPSDPLFDGERRDAKRLTRRLERVYTPPPLGAKLAPGLQRLLPWLLLRLPSLRGTTSVGGTGNFGMRSAVRFGVRRLNLTDRHRGDSGGSSTHSLVVGDSQLALRSLSMNSINFLSTRLPRSDQVLLAQLILHSLRPDKV